VETSPYRVAVLQKDFISLANKRGKLVIVATQMLESMISNPSPTRAESTDVANAILDGTDAVMLSGETAVGSYPVEAVRTMARIAEVTEGCAYYNKEFVNLSLRERYAPHAICEAAEWASRDLGDAPVIVFTYSGDTALYLSKIRNQSPIYAFSPSADVPNMLGMVWNVRAFPVAVARDVVALLRGGEEMLLKHKLVRRGDHVVVITGTSLIRGATNLLRIKRVGQD
jgi:pyruvate kinase